MASAEVEAREESLNMAGDDDDYGDAFKKAKLERVTIVVIIAGHVETFPRALDFSARH